MINSCPLVSVIIPTYRRSEFLVRAILSVLDQSYRNIEIIVVDDNHGNDSYRLATKEKIKEFHHLIKYIEHDQNKGVVQARNTGIANVQGEYIAFLDDDDEWFITKIEIQIKLFNKLPDRYGVVYCGHKVITEGVIAEQIITPKFRGNLSKILGLNHIGPPSVVLCKKKFLELINGFDDRIIYREDLDFFYRLSHVCYFDFVETPLVNYYFHEGSKSNNNQLRLKGMISFLNIYSSELKTNKVRWSEIMERLAELHIINNQQLKSIFSFLESFFYRPKRVKILGKLFLSFLGSSLYVKLKRR